ncbi:MAG: hypothetical protein IK038_10915 [Bacteroidaceae bacterium]|nr:hypothetical protein [Bacteroidaceae bacterium]
MKLNNPWLALSTYEEEDSFRFKGREEDTENIITMLQQNEYIVCYSVSGDGKSSLINAGLCPSMRKLGYFPIKIVFTSNEYDGIGLPVIEDDKNQRIDFDKLILSKIEQSIEVYKKKVQKNNDIDEFKVSFKKMEQYKNVDDGLSNNLWWKLRSEYIRISFGEFKYVPVIIFDQFEEVFRAKWKDEFFVWLESLSNDVVPSFSSNILSLNTSSASFEKKYKMIFSMRYEYIGELDYWCSQRCFIPQLKRSRYFLKALTKEQAKRVIVDQTLGMPEILDVLHSRADEIIKQIIGETSKQSNAKIKDVDEVSAILLSLMCYTYYQHLKASNDTQVPEAKNLIKEYYLDRTKYCLADKETKYNLESSLISNDTSRRKRVLLKDIKELNRTIISNECIGNYLLSNEIVLYVDSEESFIKVNDNASEIIKEKGIYFILDIPAISMVLDCIRDGGVKSIEEIDGWKTTFTLTLGDILVMEHIIRRHNINNDIYIELVHDKLAEVLKDEVNSKKEEELHQHKREQNVELRKKREHVLTLSGRQLIENHISIGENQDDNRNSILSQILGNLKPNKNGQNINTNNFGSSLLLLANDSIFNNYICLSFLEPDNKNGYILSHTRDGINYIATELYDDENRGKIKSVHFLDENNKPLTIRTGFCGIELIYDKNGNEIKRIYLNNNNEPTYTTQCYAIIEREYDYEISDQPVRTRYLSPTGERTRHIEGNHGYESQYDLDGREILRLFIDSNDDRCPIKRGIYAQRFVYKDDRLTYIVNLDKDLNPVEDAFGNICCKYEYDELDRIITETSCRICDDLYEPVTNMFGYCSLKIEYDEYGRIEKQVYTDESGNPITRNDGFSGFIIHYDKYSWPDRVSYFDINGKNVCTDNGAIIERRYDKIGQEIEIKLLGEDSNPLYNSIGICCMKIEYNDRKLPQRHIYYNHKQQCTGDDVPTFYSHIEYYWDEEGRNPIEIRFFKQNSDNPVQIIKKEWKDDNHYVAVDSMDKSKKNVTVNEFDLPIKEDYINKGCGELENLQYYSKEYVYNIKRKIVKEFYYNYDGSPFVDELGDSGTEFFYDKMGVLMGLASLGEDKERHRNIHGWAVRMCPVNSESESIEEYYDVDGISPVMVDEGYHKYIVRNKNNKVIREYYDKDGKITNCKKGYAIEEVIFEKDNDIDIETITYFDTDGSPAYCGGCHKIVRSYVLKDDENVPELFNYEYSCYDEYDQLINNDEGIAIRRVEKCNGLKAASYKVYYKNSDDEYVDGYNPQGSLYPRGCIFLLDKNFVTYYAKAKDGKELYGHATKFKKDAIFYLFLIPYLLLLVTSFACYVLWLLIIQLCKTIKIIFNKERKKTYRLVYVNKIIKTIQDKDDNVYPSISNLAGIESDDIIIEFGNWRYIQYDDMDSAIDEFENEFNTNTTSYKLLAVAHYNKKKWTIDRYWVPQKFGVSSLGDRVIIDNDLRIQSLLKILQKN